MTVQIQPFADILPGRLASHLEATSPAVAAAAHEVLQQVKKAAPGTMHKVQNLVSLQKAKLLKKQQEKRGPGT